VDEAHPNPEPAPRHRDHPTEVGLARLLGYFPRLGAKSKPWSPVSTAAAAGALSGAVVALTRQAITDWPPPIAVTGLLWFKIPEPVVVSAGALGLLIQFTTNNHRDRPSPTRWSLRGGGSDTR
jgi:hypothetical protein